MELKTVNRFVSTLAGAFRSFYIYNLDNKAFEEILQNLARRFQDTQQPPAPIHLTISSRSLLLDGEPVGYQDLTIPFAAVLRGLGYKEVRFHAPLHSRNFFQFLHILTGKDSFDAKNEKLIALVDDGETKPISLVPITANSYLLRLSDEVIKRRLASLTVPTTHGGPAWVEKMAQLKIDSMPDLYTWCIQRAESLDEMNQAFTKNLIKATQEGYFPWERFLRLFPVAENLRHRLRNKLDGEVVTRERKASVLGHRYIPEARLGKKPQDQLDAFSLLAIFSSEETEQHRAYRNSGAASSASMDLDLADALIKAEGSDFTLGVSILVRTLSEKNPVSVQEKALRLAKNIWTVSQESEESNRPMTLLSALRQQLTSPANVELALFPVREAAIESSVFTDMSRYFLSLGKACLWGLIDALESEQDRAMRKKICQLITVVAREDGLEILLEALGRERAFLTRNIVMILGDIRAAQATPSIVPLLRHTQKIVRNEAIRALCQINTNESQQAVASVATQVTEPALKRIIYQTLSPTKYRDVLRNGTWI